MSMGEYEWRPTVFDACGDQFVTLNPHDHSLCLMLAAEAGMTPFKQAKPTRASLVGCPGFEKIKKLRNDAQASEMAPKCRGLFDDEMPQSYDESHKMKKNKKCHRKWSDIVDQRGRVESFEVHLDSKRAAIMLRPILNADMIAIKCDATNIDNVLSFIVEHGITPDSLFQKRLYATSGKPGVFMRGNKKVDKHGKKIHDSKSNDDDLDENLIDNSAAMDIMSLRPALE